MTTLIKHLEDYILRDQGYEDEYDSLKEINPDQLVDAAYELAGDSAAGLYDIGLESLDEEDTADVLVRALLKARLIKRSDITPLD